jgi:hypothetical protein
MDEASVGQKGRLCHRWWTRGQRPPGRCDRRFQGAYIFAAVEPATGVDVALVLPQATTTTMSLFLAEFAASLPENVHAVLVLDGAGWHGARALTVPPNVTLVPLPPYSPELGAHRDRTIAMGPDQSRRAGLAVPVPRASSRCGSSPTTAPSSMPAARPGTASSPSRVACDRSAISPGSKNQFISSAVSERVWEAGSDWLRMHHRLGVGRWDGNEGTQGAEAAGFHDRPDGGAVGADRTPDP